jgi:hypothetical protein
MKTVIKIPMICLLLIGIQVSGQEKTAAITMGEKQSFQSSILGETRSLLVYAPEKISVKLPLVLVFDAETLFGTAVAAVNFMNHSSEIPQMPEAVVVGIPNMNRNRDMPIPQEYGRHKGEANFMKFLKDELLPYLNKQYALNGHIICIGHSQGGLLVSYLVTQEPGIFSWAIALDAPMTVTDNINTLKEDFARVIQDEKNKTRYASIETLFGWEKDLPMVDSGKLMRSSLLDETHESMPFKGMYDGLAFLYHDFRPLRKDMKLVELRAYYNTLSEKYGHAYEVPLKVLTASASRKMMESRKAEVNDLINYAESKYPFDKTTSALKLEASKLTMDPSAALDSILGLSRPTPEKIRPYLGHWVGTLTVREGRNMPLDIEIVIENGKAVMRSVLPFPPYKKEEPAIFSVSAKGELVFGRKNRGAGLVVSTAKINAAGHLTGEEWLIGFVMPDDMPADIREKMNFIIKNPNVFDLVKK